jgi:hypothetical protein
MISHTANSLEMRVQACIYSARGSSYLNKSMPLCKSNPEFSPQTAEVWYVNEV